MLSRLVQLHSILQDLSDRFGSEDPVIAEIRAEIEGIEQARAHKRLPYGERRTLDGSRYCVLKRSPYIHISPEALHHH